MAKHQGAIGNFQKAPIRTAIGLVGLGLAAAALLSFAFGLGFPGFGWKKTIALLIGIVLMLVGFVPNLKGAQLWLSENKRRLLAIVLQVVILLAILGGVELMARANQGYLLWKNPLEKANVYFELDKVKNWNRKFYESREQYFREWPIPIDFFEASTQFPRYVFKPNKALKRQGDEALVVKPGDPKAFWWSNSWGFRGDEFSVQKPAGTFRIVALGASTTEGSQSNLETYPHFLQKELQKRYPGRAIEVLNAGHHGQGIDDLLEIMKQRVVPLKPDLVLFYEGNNDIGWADYVKADPSCNLGTCWLNAYPGWYRWAYNNSASFVFLANRFGWNTQKPPQAAHEFITSKATSPAHYRKVLSDIVREAKTHNIPIVLSSFVTLAHEGLEVSHQENSGVFDALYKMFYPLTPGEIKQIFDIVNQQSASVAREFNLPYADIAAQFPQKLQYFPFDIIHFTPEGNQLVASFFADSLAKNGLLDAKEKTPQAGMNSPAPVQ